MPNINNLYSSKFLKASQFKESGPQNLTIKSVTQDVVGEGDDAQVKPIVMFNEVDQGLTLNKTNGQMIAHLCEDEETNNWIGKQVQLYQDITPFKGDIVDCIRIRAAAPIPGEVAEDTVF